MKAFLMMLVISFVHLNGQTVTLTDNTAATAPNLTVGDSFSCTFHGAVRSTVLAYGSHDGGVYNGPYTVGTTDDSGALTVYGTASDTGVWTEQFTIGGVNAAPYPLYLWVFSTASVTETSTYAGFQGLSTTTPTASST
jgi:hypothetical protein